METRADLDEVPHGREVLLFCMVGPDQVRCLARKTWFETERPGERREGWQSTWDGKPVPLNWRPYAYGDPTPPDPALADDGY